MGHFSRALKPTRNDWKYDPFPTDEDADAGVTTVVLEIHSVARA